MGIIHRFLIRSTPNYASTHNAISSEVAACVTVRPSADRTSSRNVALGCGELNTRLMKTTSGGQPARHVHAVGTGRIVELPQLAGEPRGVVCLEPALLPGPKKSSRPL
ncbi:hypothetical protein GXB81_12455 [Paraburkholderia sp. Ac-20336]|nr:hypothetical protein [Paraburkholderia sp. Ac-20336]